MATVQEERPRNIPRQHQARQAHIKWRMKEQVSDLSETALKGDLRPERPIRSTPLPEPPAESRPAGCARTSFHVVPPLWYCPGRASRQINGQTKTQNTESKQTNNQTIKQANKQANRQTTRQTNKQTASNTKQKQIQTNRRTCSRTHRESRKGR